MKLSNEMFLITYSVFPSLSSKINKFSLITILILHILMLMFWNCSLFHFVTVGGMTLRLRDPESPVKSLRSDVPLSPREVSTSLTEIPTFCPTEEEFQRPLQYIQSIAPRAEPFGMCKVIPPSSWKVTKNVT